MADEEAGSPTAMDLSEGVDQALVEPIGSGRASSSSAHEGLTPDRQARRARGPRQPQSELLAAVFESPRDIEGAYTGYVRYRDRGCHRRDLTRAFDASLPVIREVCRSRDRVLVGAAAWAIFRALRSRRFKKGGKRAYWAYLRQTARGALAHQRESDDRFQLVDWISPQDCFDGMGITGRLVNFSDVERKLVIEKIPILVAEQVVRRLRFEGEERNASLYILRSLLEGRDVVVRGLRVLFDLPCERLRQIVDHVTVAARIALSRIRRELEAAGGESLGWRGAISMTAWLYGEDDDDRARGA